MYSVANRENLQKCFSAAMKPVNDPNAISKVVTDCYAELNLVFTPNVQICVQECLNEYVVENYAPLASAGSAWCEPGKLEIFSHTVGEINVGLCYYNCETYS